MLWQFVFIFAYRVESRTVDEETRRLKTLETICKKKKRKLNVTEVLRIEESEFRPKITKTQPLKRLKNLELLSSVFEL